MNNFLVPPPAEDVEAQRRFYNALFLLRNNEQFNIVMQVVTENYTRMQKLNNAEANETRMRQGQGMLMFIDDLYDHSAMSDQAVNALEQLIREKMGHSVGDLTTPPQIPSLGYGYAG